MIKRILLILTLALLPLLVQAQNNSADTGKLPLQGTQIGGKGADGKFHFISVDNSGNLTTSGGTTNVSVVNTATSVNTPTVITATSTSGVLVAANANRAWAQLQNTGLNEVDCAVNATPTTAAYHFALRAGGVYTIDSSNYHTLAVSGICASGQTSTVAVLEGTK